MSGGPAPTPGEDHGEPVVPFVRVRCRRCRRRVSQEMENARKGGAGLPRVDRPQLGVCPHYETVWAPGQGPGGEPPPGSGWSDRRPPV